MIERLNQITQRAVKNFSRGKMIFIGVVAVFEIVSNIMKNPVEQWIGDLLLLISPFVLTNPYRELLANESSKADGKEDKRGFVNWIRRNLLLPIFLVAILDLFMCMVSWLVSLDKNLQIANQQSVGTIVGDLITDLLSSTEEVWRWSMIITTLWCFRTMIRSTEASLRGRFLLLAIFLSSIFFGLAHFNEFSYGQWLPVTVLSVDGMIFACMAIVTRRFGLIMVVHALYDTQATLMKYANIPFTVALITASTIFLLGLVVFGFHRLRGKPHGNSLSVSE